LDLELPYLSRPDLREGPASFVFDILLETKNPSTGLDCFPPYISQETNSDGSHLIFTPILDSDYGELAIMVAPAVPE
jgi:hypothetical protein